MQKNNTPTQIQHLVFQFFRKHMTRMHSRFEEIGIFRGQPPVLHHLAKSEGCTQTELAEIVHLAPATVTKMLQSLEQSGLIERRHDPNDQRVLRVYLTPAGREILSAIGEREREVEEEMLTGFSAEELAQLADFLARMRDNLLQANRDRQPRND
jgi:MarR family transcriptional regulator, organic hydroperoxide resistance regulator